jgi:ABC-2 type transport system permease protein
VAGLTAATPPSASTPPSAGPDAVVGLVVRLRLAMWRTAMTRSPLHLASSVVGGLAALVVLAVLGPGLLLLAGRPLRIVALTVPLFTVVTLMWAVLSLVATGVDATLDPARFAVLPLRAPELARGLLAAALTGIPAVMLIGLALAQVGAWLAEPAAALAALVAAVLGVLTAVLLSRAVTSALARVMTTRGGRLLGAVVVSLVTLLPLGLNLLLATDSLASSLATFDATRSAQVASWTPVGWAWGLPFDVATGRWGSAVAHLLLAVGFIALLRAVWVRALERSLTSPLTSSGGQRIGAGRFLPAVLGTSPTATIAARRVRAWYRDSRLVGIALRTAVLPVFFIAQAVVTDAPGLAGIGIVTLAVFAGLTLMNDLAFDGPAWWLHVAVGVKGWEDRLGRALASVLVFGPVVALAFVVAVAIGAVRQPLPWLTVVVVAFLSSLGLAVAVGAVLPGTAPRTGGNPFAATSGGAAQGCLTAVVSFVGPMLLTMPVVAAAVLTSATPTGRWVTLAVGTAYALGLLAVGVVLGGRRLDRRSPELLAQLAHSQM